MTSKINALKLYAKEVSSQILSGSIPPLEGASLIWRAHINSEEENFHDLDGFIYAASETDDRLEDKALFDQGILKEARRVVDTY